MDTRSTDPNDSPERLPAAVRARLDAAHGRAASVDPAVDEAVLTQARRYFAMRGRPADATLPAERRPQDVVPERVRIVAGSPSRRVARRRYSAEERSAADRRARRWSTRWAAAAAAAAVAFTALLIVQPGSRLGYDPDDVDRSGRVDILDAFALARQRADGASVSQAEIDAVAMRVVSLEPRRASR